MILSALRNRHPLERKYCQLFDALLGGLIGDAGAAGGFLGADIGAGLGADVGAGLGGIGADVGAGLGGIGAGVVDSAAGLGADLGAGLGADLGVVGAGGDLGAVGGLGGAFSDVGSIGLGGDLGAVGGADLGAAAGALPGDLGAVGSTDFGGLGGAFGSPAAGTTGGVSSVGAGAIGGDLGAVGDLGGLPAGDLGSQFTGFGADTGALPTTTADPFSGDFGSSFAGTGGPPDFLNQFQQTGLGLQQPGGDIASNFGGVTGNTFPGGTIPNPATVGDLPVTSIPSSPDFVSQFSDVGLGPGTPATATNVISSDFGNLVPQLPQTGDVLSPTPVQTIGVTPSGPGADVVPGVDTPGAAGLQPVGASQGDFADVLTGQPNPVGTQFAGGPAPVTSPDVLPGVPSTPTPASPISADIGTASLPADVSPTTPFASTVSAGTGGVPGSASGGFGSFIAQNPLMAASLGIGAAGLGLSALRSTQQLPDQSQLNAIASQLASNSAAAQANANQLIAPLITGQLPGPQAQQVQQALQDAITATKAKYASMGLSGSTAEQDEIASQVGRSIALSGQLEQIMANAGIQLSSQATQDLNIESQIFQSLMNANINADNALTQAVAAFAGQSAIAGALTTRKAA